MLSSTKSVLSIALASLVLAGCQTATKTQPQSTAIPSAETEETPYATATTAQAQPETIPVQETKAPDDLWQLARESMQLELYLDQSRVQTQLKWYEKHPAYMNRVAKRATPYFYHIVNEAIRRDLPVELALLPIVESAFDPFAYSHGRAAGPWQFIPSTGKYFGLKQNWWYDGRRDILSSTDAAYKYLERLNKRFDGDWLLALAAYNAGGGTISKAIKRNKRAGKPTDFWSLKLPKETMAYVPKLLAISALVKYADQYNLTLLPIANKPHFAAVDTSSQIDIAQAAAMADISTKEMYLLNPGFNRWATAPDGPHRLLVPVASEAAFKASLAELPKEQRMQWTRYKIRSGDSLIAIAKRFNTSVSLIKDTNKISGSRIRAGQTLLVPRATQNASEYVLSQHQRHIQKQKDISRTTNRQETYHTVKSGDSFWSIAKHYNVGVRQLARWNSMAPGDSLRTGKRLVIWSEPKPQLLSSNDRQVIRKIGYKVRSGDSLSVIADKFSVKVADILRWNKLDRSKYIKPGQRLTLYVDVTRIN